MAETELIDINTSTSYPFDPKIKEFEDEISNEDDTEVSPPADIVAFNELRSCADLLRMVQSVPAQIDIAPDFQRSFVWKPAEQARFIDSLIKELPIPSLCISYDFKTNKRLVIDGKQRITTIVSFLADPNFKISSLKDIDQRISGKTVTSIKNNAETSILYEKVQNLMIPITVIRCDSSNKSHMQYIFKIFHRLNSGGAKLNNQEIRNGLYNGIFNNFLKESVGNAQFRSLMNINNTTNYRYAYEELILRFFSLFDGLHSYDGKLSGFVNDYMYSKSQKEAKHLDELVTEIDAKRILFNESVKIIFESIFDSKAMQHKSKAFIEALFIAVIANLDYLKEQEKDTIKRMYEVLSEDENFAFKKLSEGVAQKTKVIERITRAIAIFSGQ